MDGRDSGASAWLDEVLRQAGIDPARLARVQSDRRPVIERSNPWGHGEGVEESAVILDAALGRRGKAGDLVFVTDMDEDPIARVQAAVQLARAAVGRGADVLLVDADIRHVGLSRWLPDRDLDAEGLVDVLQYGASIGAARRPSQIEGIDVLGIGSYRPDLSGIFGADDARRLQAQLRASAQLAIVVGPARLADGSFHPLLRGVDAVALSMHADRSLAEPLAEFLGYLSERQLPLAGVFLWAGPGDADRFVDDALLERSRVLPPANPKSPFPARKPAEPDPAPEAGPSGASSPPSADPAPGGATSSGPVEAEAASSVRMYTERGRHRSAGGTSQGLRLVMVVVAIGIVGFLAWWGLTWRSVEPTRPRVQPPARPPAVARQQPSSAAPADTAEVASPEPAGTAGEEPVGGGEAAKEPQATAAGDTSPPPVETSRDVDGLLSEPVESAPLEPAPAEATPEEAPAGAPATGDPFEEGLRRAGGGWGLHLFSFTDSLEAAAEADRLEAEGYATAVRGADIKGRHWYRVLVGDFADRGEAGRYREAAQEKFHVDWVGVVKK